MLEVNYGDENEENMVGMAQEILSPISISKPDKNVDFS